MARQIILDTETTGLSPKQGHRVIEIGCIELVNRSLTERQFHVYLNPERDIEKEAQAVHGLTDAFLKDKPKFADIADELVQFISGAELVIHNAPFDVGFLNHELSLLGSTYRLIDDYCTIFDTLTFARTKHPGQKNSLDALCDRYEIDRSGRELHGALLDVRLLCDVYLAMSGGQTDMFQVDAWEDTQSDSKIASIQLSKPLPIYEPTQEEQAAHEVFMELLEG